MAFRGEADRAFEWLDKAVAYHDTGLTEIAVDPLFANSRRTRAGCRSCASSARHRSSWRRSSSMSSCHSNGEPLSQTAAASAKA